MTEPFGPLELFACPHTCPHTQAGFREDSLVGCYLFTGFHHDYVSRHASLPALHRFCNSNCQVQTSTPTPTSRPASAAEIKRWLPWLSGLTADPNKRAWFERYIARYPQYAPYYFTSPPPGLRPTSSPFTDGREGVPINATWFSNLHLGILPDPDPPAPQRNTPGPHLKLASSYTEFFRNSSSVREDAKPLACITYYERRKSEIEAPTSKRKPVSKNVIDLTLLRKNSPQSTKMEPVEDVIPPKNAVDQSIMCCEDTSQPMIQTEFAQDEMLVDHPSDPSYPPTPVQSPFCDSEVKVESPSAFLSAGDSRSTETSEFQSVSQSAVCLDSSRLKASATPQSSDSSVGTSPLQQDECFPSTIAGFDHPAPIPHPLPNATVAKEPPMTLEMYACPHTCPHTAVGFREDSLEGCYLFTGFDRGHVSRHASLQAIHGFCSAKCYVQAVAPNATSRLASDAEIKRWLPWLSGLAANPDKRAWFEDYISKYPQYASYYFTSPPLGLQPEPSPFTDGRKGVPVSSKWPRRRGTLPNPNPPPPQSSGLTRAASYTHFFDGLVQSRRLFTLATYCPLTSAESPELRCLEKHKVRSSSIPSAFPSAVQHSPTPESQVFSESTPSSSIATYPPRYSLATEREYLFTALAALFDNPPPAQDPPRNAAEFNAIHWHYNIEQFVKNIQDGSLREIGFYPHMVGASPL